ncbi:MAG: alpha/beta hydrolase fold domain-containing protein [Vicinamibacterales bacterium]
MRKTWLLALTALVLSGPFSGSATAQSADATREFIHVSNNYSVISNVVYRTVSNWDAKLDIYQPRGITAPNPTVMMFHGGGWTTGSKESRVFGALPYLQMGWTVVNVEYRLTNVALAPAAVEDARCALRWVYRNAKQYNFDPSRIVTTGESAGGHLAMITALLPMGTGVDNTCPGERSGGASNAGPTNTDELKVAAVVDWYGISDVVDLMGGPNQKPYAVAWLGMLPNRQELGKLLSPQTHVRAGATPVISIHGDADPTVPYSQKQRFHQMMGSAKASHELVTIPNGKHGGFNDAEMLTAFTAIRAFLAKHNLPTGAASAPTTRQ